MKNLFKKIFMDGSYYIEYLNTLAQNNVVLGCIIMFVMIIVGNIVPMMLFLYPDIPVLLGVYLAKKVIAWRIPFILLIVGSYIGEVISFYIGKKYGDKVLNIKFFKKKNIKERIDKFHRNSVKTLIIGKIIPGVTWFIPVLSGITKMNTKKFLIFNFIMVVYAISSTFLVLIIGVNILEKFLGNKTRIIIGAILIVYTIGHIIFSIISKKKKLDS